MTKHFGGLAALAVVLFPAAAIAAPPAVTPAARADIRCAAVSLAMVNSDDQASSQAGLMSLFFFAGRAEGRLPTTDVMELVAQEASAFTAADFESESKRCGKVLVDKGEEWQAKGKELQERGVD
ncbi:MAG: hypothetical protein KA105_02975 [Caulobacter sp.]|nr:hypothetical protein [Caulobacter sp.]